MVRGCIATPRDHHRRLPPDGWWPLAVTGGICESDVCSCREQTCLDGYIKLLDHSVTILQYSYCEYYHCIKSYCVIQRCRIVINHF